MFEKYSDVVGVDELCEMLNIGKNTAYYLLKSKAIKSFRIGHCFKIPKKYVIDFCLADSNCKELKLCDNISL